MTLPYLQAVVPLAQISTGGQLCEDEHGFASIMDKQISRTDGTLTGIEGTSMIGNSQRETEISHALSASIVLQNPIARFEGFCP
jgi:hypothetical protein